MVNRNLLRQYDPPQGELEQELDAAFDYGGGEWLPPEAQEFRDNRVVTGRVRKVSADDVWVDVGYKSEGLIGLREWYDEGLGQVVPPRPGDEVEVLLEAVEDETGAIVLSYFKARRQKEGEAVVGRRQGGDRRGGRGPHKDEGRLVGNRRRPPLPPGKRGDPPPPAAPPRLPGQAQRGKDHKDRRGPPQHPRQPPPADRGPARGPAREAA